MDQSRRGGTTLKLGLLSAILPDSTFEEVIDIAKANRYEAVELACWPKGKSERRYAGVTHIDVDTLDEFAVNHILDYTSSRGVEIMALGYYPNPLDKDEEKRQFYFSHIKKVIKAASRLGVNRISTFIGKDQTLPEEENYQLFLKYWPEIIAYAESLNVKVGIENCPMYFTKDEWPGGKNLASSPVIWRKMFRDIPSDYFGLSYDPSHLHLQRMDYLLPIEEFKDKLFHVHLKDILVYEDKINDYGIFTYPLNYMSPKIPGEGGIDWKAFITALKSVGYDQCACIEIEDKDYEDSFENILKAIQKSQAHIRPYL